MPSFLALGRLAVVPLLLATAWVTGCAAAAAKPPVPPSQPAFIFPSRAELDALPTRPASPRALGADGVRVDAWTFAAPPAHAGDAYDDGSPWGTLLGDVLAKRRAEGGPVPVRSPALRCAAEEIGRFFLAHHALPSESLRRFTVARCGGTAPDVRPMVWSIDAAPSRSEDSLFWRSELEVRQLLTAHLASDGARTQIVGLARVRDGARLVIAALTAPENARVEAGLRHVDASRHVRIEGTLTTDADQVRGWINQGSAGVAACEAEAGLALPRFAFRCSVDAGDRLAWVEVVAAREGSPRLEPVANLLACDGDESDIAYRSLPRGAPALVGQAADFAPAVLDRLNEVRRSAKLAPLTLAVRQSSANARLAGTVLDANSDADSDVADTIAVGLVAGWDVDGLVKRADFLVAAVPQTRDAAAWLAYALERPMGRRILLDPNASQIAIGGAIADGVDALGAAVTTYELFESNDHSGDARHVVDRVAALRAERRLPPPIRIASVDELAPEARSVFAHAKRPAAALDDGMHAVSNHEGHSVVGWVLESTDLDALTIPASLLRPGPLKLAVEVTHHRAPGGAWGQYVVLIVGVGLMPDGRPF